LETQFGIISSRFVPQVLNSLLLLLVRELVEISFIAVMVFGTPCFTTATKHFLNNAWLLFVILIFVTKTTLEQDVAIFIGKYFPDLLGYVC
tara:strand:- start:117 stop:389 length:273 start_codon:yes stop_codon:yes gene_type:complete